MKRLTSIMAALIIVLSLLCVTASAAYISKPSNSSNKGSMSAASVNSSIIVTINGNGYYVAGGAESTVGYGYENDYDYVYICQLACNRMYEMTANNYIPCQTDVGTVDGIFGPKTYNGIYNFQRYSNMLRYVDPWPELTVDGICGDNTWERFADMCN